MRADVVLAFGPQVVLAPSERKALRVGLGPYDRSLRTLDADGEAEGFARMSLLDVARAFMASANEPTHGDLGDEPSPAPPQRAPPPAPAPPPARQQPVAATTPQEGKPPRTTRIHIFAGDKCAADVYEANLLEKAISTAHQSTHAAVALSCSTIIVPGSDHGVAAAMRDSGALQEVLCRHCT